MKKVLMKSKHVVLLLLITLLTIGFVGVTSNNNVVNAETNNVTVDKSYFSLDYSNNELTLLFSPSLNAYANIQKGDLTELKNAIISVANDIIFTKDNESKVQSLRKHAIRKSNSTIGSEVDVSLVENIIKGQITDIEVVEANLLDFGTYDVLLKFYVDRYTDEYIKKNPTATTDVVLDQIADSISTAVNEKVTEVYEQEGLGEYAPTADVEAKIKNLVDNVKDLKADNKSVDITLGDVADVFDVIGYSTDVIEVIKTVDASKEINTILKESTGDEITDFFTKVDIDQLMEVTKETNIIVKDNINEIASKVGMDNIVKIADTVGVDKLKEFAKTIDMDTSDVNQIIKDNLSNIKFTDLFKIIKSIKVNNDLVFANKEVITAGIKKIITQLPKLSEIANFTDKEMRLSWDIEIETIVGTKSFKFTVGFDGDCSKIRRLAELAARYIAVYRENGVYHLDVTTPVRLSDFLLAATQTAHISDSLKQKVFRALSLEVNEVYDFVQELTIQDIINILKKVDYKKIVNKLIDADVLNKYFHTTAFTDERIDKIIDELIKVGQKAQKVTYEDIERVMTTVLGTNVLENHGKIKTYINKVLNLFDKINFDNLSVERIRNFADPNSSSTNEKIYSYIDKLVRFEDEFNKLKEYLTKIYNKLPERFKNKTLFDFYKGAGEFAYSGTFSIDSILEKFTTEKFNAKDIISMLFDYLPETISVSFDLQAADIYKVNYVVGSTTKSGFLPVGANLQFFAQTTELNGHAITKWVDEYSNEYASMPDKDITLYAVTEFNVKASNNINKTYDGTSSILSVEVEGSDDTYYYQWYKNGVKIEGATESQYLVTNVKDSGEYYCAVSTATGYNESRVIKVTINKAKVDVSNLQWNVTEEIVYDGAMHTVELINIPSLVTVSYTGNKGTDANTYTAVATFTLVDDENYELVNNTLTYVWSITPLEITLPTFIWSVKSAQVYNGNAYQAFITNLPEGITAVYENDNFTNVGAYTTKAIISVDNNHKLAENEFSYSWSITPLEIKVNNLEWSIASSNVYNGNAFIASVTNLPEFVNATYQNNTATNVGTYTTTVTLTTDENHKLNKEVLTFTWKITPCEIELPELTWSGDEFQYSGAEFEVLILNLPEGVEATYKDNKKVNASTYTAVATLSVDSNHKIAKTTFTHTWKITPLDVEITASQLQWVVDDSVVYTGNEIKNVITNLDSYITAMYSNNKATNVGEYTTTAVLSVDSNHKLSQSKFTKTWKITPAEIVVSELTWSVKPTQVYNGTELTATITNLPEGVEVEYQNNKGTDAGTYTTTATLTVDSNHTIAFSVVTYEWKITPKTIFLTSVTWSYNEPFIYDGKAHEVVILDLPAGVEVIYQDNSAISVGTYTAKAILSVKDKNSELSQSVFTCEWEIKLSTNPTDTKKDFASQDGTIKVIAKNGVPSDNNLNVIDKTNDYKDVDLSKILGKNEKGEIKGAYDIRFEKNGTEVTVADDFTVRMLIPEKLLNKTIKVIHIDDAGNVTDIQFTREGNYVVFQTTHFSIYAIVQVASTHTIPWIIWVIIALLIIFIIGLVVAILLKHNDPATIEENEFIQEMREELVNEETNDSEKTNDTIDLETDEESDDITEEEKVSFEEEKPVEIPEPETENDKFEDSYFGNLINAEDDTKGYYAILKKEILSYCLEDQNVETKISWHNETFMINDEMVARFKMRNNKLYVSLPLTASEYLETSDITDPSTTFICCIKNGRRCKYTKGLISIVMNKYGLTKRGNH